jgi:cytochrome c553
MQGMKLISMIPALVALALSGQVLAEASPEAADTKGDAAKGKEIASQVCAACHGVDGNSPIPANPTLAGQHAEYIIKQLKNFKSEEGKPAERESPIMTPMVAPLSVEDMKNVAAYYAQQTPKPGVANDKELAQEGEKIYRGGNLETSLPACSSCHSPNGVGIPPNYPRLAGQHAEYSAAQLRAFRTEQRTNDVNAVMQMITNRMTEKEMQAVSEFISGLRK